MAIELSDELIKLEQQAWAEMQAEQLTVDTAIAVHAATVEHAKATKQSRYDVEMELKLRVRNPEAYEERERKRREAAAKK